MKNFRKNFLELEIAGKVAYPISNTMKKFLIGLLLFAAVFADLGPGPSPPDITLNLIKAGSPYTGNVTVTFLCKGANSSEPRGAVEPYNVELSCTKGKCVAGNWYYKFNPCFYGNGSFEIESEGRKVVTDEVSFEKEGGTYDFTVDVETGNINETGNMNSSSYSQIPNCPSSFILLSIPALAAFFARK